MAFEQHANHGFDDAVEGTLTRAPLKADIHRDLEAGAMGVSLPEINFVEDVNKAAHAAFYYFKCGRGICPAVSGPLQP